MNCDVIAALASLNTVPNITTTRAANSFWSLVSICASRWQCGQVVNMKGITTILPLKLESRICLPAGSVMVNSGDLRGTGGMAKAETVSATNEVAARIRTAR